MSETNRPGEARRRARIDDTRLTPARLAERLGVSVSTVHRWVRAGCPARQSVPCAPIWFDLAEVEAWLRRPDRRAGHWR